MLLAAIVICGNAVSKRRTSSNLSLATGFSCLNSLSWWWASARRFAEDGLGDNKEPFTPSTPTEIRWRKPVGEGGAVCKRFPVIVLFPPPVDVVVLMRERAVI